MKLEKPYLFEYYPELEGKIPWTPLLTGIPTDVDRLQKLEKHFELDEGKIYIKRDDKDHHIYGGNKLRKFEFIFGDALEKEKIGIATMGGIGTNHGLAAAIIAKELQIKCDLLLFPQPITWHVQRSLLLYDYFGANLHLCGGDVSTLFKLLWFQITHPKYYMMMPGGTPLFGIGTSLGTIGFINAICELNNQINDGMISKPDDIFIAGGSTGTAAGLVAGVKLLDLDILVNVVPVYGSLVANPKAVIRNSKKAIKYLRNRDKSIPKLKITKDDFNFHEGYLGSTYGKKTERGQYAVDIVEKLEGKEKGFKLETTYTGKAMAAMFDYIKNPENKDRTVLFWNTYNSNDLDEYLRKTEFDFERLPEEFHQFYKDDLFQCWQLHDCKTTLEECPTYLNHEYRCWKVKNCTEESREKCKAYKKLKDKIILEEA
ncbi:MAG: pyridoxal-phosphate dependent enzyme [Candidatus Lokiarchaeota archaeon]|nr:pyridoxal-phosphate dependent enzyme [Candidatus Lokiarchaeota archaeon]